MVIYADITFIKNFLMSLAIIWAVANILEIKYRWLNIILAAVAANIYLFMVFFMQLMNVNLFIISFIHIILNILAAVVIIRIAFPGVNKTVFLKTLVYLYLVSFVSIGTTLSVFYIYRGPLSREIRQAINLGAIVVLLIGNFGWRIFQKYKTPEQFFIPLKIYYRNNIAELIGLLDTGNSLTDPFTRAPVVVANLDDILPLFPSDIQEGLIRSGEDYLTAIDILNKAGLGDRVRILPFSDLGQENGIIPGFRPDLIELQYKERVLKIKKCIIAISRRKLDLEDEYQALIHPQLVGDDGILENAL
ncbi:MAG: sigma-E processing peptidase SpoIIGA [Halanaerobiales bacterium]